MSLFSNFFSQPPAQQIRLTLTGFSLCVAMLSGIALWAAHRIDEQVLQREILFVTSGLQEQVTRIQKEQDSSAIWDEAVVAARANDGPWLEENLVEWIGKYYGHEYVLLLNSKNQVVRIAVNGLTADPSKNKPVADAALRIVQRLRAEMAKASAGSSESTEAISGLGEADFVRFTHGAVGLVSVRPILPGSSAVQQAPGTEFLHVSVNRRANLTPYRRPILTPLSRR